MKRPWMPLYVADYRIDTAHLSTIEHGAYLLLIMHYWASGKLPTDDPSLARVAGLTIKEWNKHRTVVSKFFDAQWRHKRIDFELSRSQDISEKRRAAAFQKHSKGNATVVHLHDK
jgi:uncharacterized protein YdaU (DUF1376 family)